MAFATPEKQKEYHRKYYLERRDELRAKMRRWRDKNKERHCAKSREYHHRNRETINQGKREKLRKYNTEINARRRQLKYGLSHDAYMVMVDTQNGQCAICGDRSKLVVDHNHETDVVRALLCSPCNTALGLFKEDADRMHAAIRYLEKYQTAQPVTQ